MLTNVEDSERGVGTPLYTVSQLEAYGEEQWNEAIEAAAKAAEEHKKKA